MSSSLNHPGILYFYSESAGLGANAICLLLAGLSNLLHYNNNNNNMNQEEDLDGNIIQGVAFLFIGGVVQLACSARAFFAHDHFGATVFGFFATFWSLLGLEQLLLLDSNEDWMNWIFMSLWIVNLALVLTSLLVNAFYMLATGTIFIVAILEFALRIQQQQQKSDDLMLCTGIVQLLVCLIILYGAVASVLHGIHQRQVLPGLDDAVLETVLWKRKPLSQSYTSGKIANPKPLGYFAQSLGLVATAAAASLTTTTTSSSTTILVVWFSMYAILGWMTSLFHGTRHESLLAVNTMTDCTFFVVQAYQYAITTTTTSMGYLQIGFALVRTLILMVTVLDNNDDDYHHISLTEVSLFAMWPLVLILDAIRLLLLEQQDEFSILLVILYSIMAALALVIATAELANAIAQKQLIPLGRRGQLFKRFSSLCNKNNNDEEEGKFPSPTLSSSSLPRTSSFSQQSFTRSTSKPRFINRALVNRNSMHGEDAFASQQTKQPEPGLTEEDDTSAENEQVAMLNKTEEQETIFLPGEYKLLGQSDFQSPLFVMMTGLGLYAMSMLITIATNSSTTCRQAVLQSLIVQLAVIYISVSRGQTSFGFLAFTFALGAVILAIPPSNNDVAIVGGGPLFIGIVILQLCWTLVSYKIFWLLSCITISHMVGLLFWVVVLESFDRGSTIESHKVQTFLNVVSGTAFGIMFFLSLTTLGLLLASPYSSWCRKWLQHFASNQQQQQQQRRQGGEDENDEEKAGKKLCPIGFAHNRNEFNKCVEILRNGGVCCIPTDTVYCLACTANSPEAIKRIYAIKNRPSEKPLSLWVGSMDDIKKVGPEGKGWGHTLFSFMHSIWPGQISLVVSRGEWLGRMGIGDAANLIGTPESIALRVPNSTLTVSLLKETGPLAITSANLSGKADCTHHDKVDDIVAQKIDYLLADGPSPALIASSVLDVRDIERGELFFYRVGCVPEQYIWKKLNTVLHYGSKQLRPTLATLDHRVETQLNPILNVIANLMKCDTWRVFQLAKTNSLDELRKDHYAWAMTWSEAKGSLGRVTTVFQTGVSFYDDDNESVSLCDSNELLVPVLKRGVICGVLQLSNKRNDDGNLAPFTDKDLRTVMLVCNQIAELSHLEQANDDDDDENISPDWAAISVVAYSEGVCRG